MTREFETGNEGQPNEPMGLPTDLLTNPEKYDGDIPLWKRTTAFIKDYHRARPQKRDNLVGGLARGVVKDPVVIVHLLNNLDLVGQLRPDFDVVGVKEQLITHAEQAIARRLDLPSWTPAKIEALVRLELDNRKPGDTESPTSTPFSLRGLIGGLMEHSTTTPPIEQAQPLSPVERLVVALFDAPRTIEESVDFHYNAAWTMIATSDPTVREEIFSILCHEKDWYTPNSISAVCVHLGMHSRDDEHLRKYYAMMDAIDKVGIFLETLADPDNIYLDSKRAWERVYKFGDYQKSPDTLKFMTQLVRFVSQRDPFRFQELSQNLEESEYKAPYAVESRDNYLVSREERKKEAERLKNLGWPQSVIEDPNEPLRKLIFDLFGPQMFRINWYTKIAIFARKGYEIYTERPVQLTPDIHLQILGRKPSSPEQKGALVREVSETLLNGKTVNISRELNAPMHAALQEAGEVYGFSDFFDAEKTILFSLWRALPDEITGRLSSILEYHRPIIPTEQVRIITEQSNSLRQEARTKFSRSLGKRGYSISITDPTLRHLGYQSISFKEVKDDNVEVNITIDGQTFIFSLDSEYRTKLSDDMKRFQSPHDQAWLELLTLSHLKKLVCTGEKDEELKAELLGGEKQLAGYNKQMVHKSEHLRRLPPGQEYSNRAWLLCLKSHFPKPFNDLDRINKVRAEMGWGGTKEAGQWTYVSGVEKDIDTQTAKPVKVAFKNASEDMRKVIDLGAVSQEELDRIVKEILAGLEAA